MIEFIFRNVKNPKFSIFTSFSEYFGTNTQYLRSGNKVHYEHFQINGNGYTYQILDKICDLGTPLLYVYTVYERPQLILKLKFWKFLKLYKTPEFDLINLVNT